jgi:exodeoxyribonuclease VII small subunit
VSDQEPDGGFEAAAKRLEQIVGALDDHTLPLDKALSLFEEGIGVSRKCAELLETARARVEKLVEETPGVFSLEAFDQPGADESTKPGTDRPKQGTDQ